MKIMFICKHNSFRSKVAEAVFKKWYSGKKHKAISRGIFKGPLTYPNTRKCVKEVGYIIKGKPRCATFEEIHEQDKIIIIANDVPKELFSGYGFLKGKVDVWEIPDTDAKKSDKIKKITLEIERRIKNFIKELE